MCKNSFKTRAAFADSVSGLLSLFRLHAVPVDVAGHPLCRGGHSSNCRLPPYNEALACCLQEALCWGEPYIFFRMSGVVSWIVGLVDRRELVGGIVGGEVLAYDGADKEALSALRHDGVPLDAARRYVARLRPWSSARIRDAASALSAAFYQISGWQPELLDENRRKAMQQRQIAEAMDAQRKLGAEASAHYPVDKERLLSLIKAGDRNGARRVLGADIGCDVSPPKTGDIAPRLSNDGVSDAGGGEDNGDGAVVGANRNDAR